MILNSKITSYDPALASYMIIYLPSPHSINNGVRGYKTPLQQFHNMVCIGQIKNILPINTNVT